MIYIGLSDPDKHVAIAEYQCAHTITKIAVISGDDFPLAIDGADQVTYSDVIMYVTYYRLLQEIDTNTLVVINECLRTQNRYDLSYNCIRHYLNQTGHQLIFQRLPLIDTADDFMVLFDFDTKSRWKRRGFDPLLIQKESVVKVNPLPVAFAPVPVATSAKTKAKYDHARQKMFAEIGNRDPHILPRNLYLIGGEDKRAYIAARETPLLGASAQYVARNQRLGLACVVPYAEVQPDTHYTLVELPHRFIDTIDFLQRTGQTHCPVLVADLKVDAWYLSRYQAWSCRIEDTYTGLS